MWPDGGADGPREDGTAVNDPANNFAAAGDWLRRSLAASPAPPPSPSRPSLSALVSQPIKTIVLPPSVAPTSRGTGGGARGTNEAAELASPVRFYQGATGVDVDGLRGTPAATSRPLPPPLGLPPWMSRLSAMQLQAMSFPPLYFPPPPVSSSAFNAGMASLMARGLDGGTVSGVSSAQAALAAMAGHGFPFPSMFPYDSSMSSLGYRGSGVGGVAGSTWPAVSLGRPDVDSQPWDRFAGDTAPPRGKPKAAVRRAPAIPQVKVEVLQPLREVPSSAPDSVAQLVGTSTGDADKVVVPSRDGHTTVTAAVADSATAASPPLPPPLPARRAEPGPKARAKTTVGRSAGGSSSGDGTTRKVRGSRRFRWDSGDSLKKKTALVTTGTAGNRGCGGRGNVI